MGYYFIKEIEHNIWNHYKYHYLDHISTVIDIHDNCWEFAMDLYSINDFRLPINSLAGDMQIPYQQVKDIAFNLASDQSHAKESVVHNADYCRIYSGNFVVDISQNEFFKQDLDNVKLTFDLSLFLDPEAAKGAGDDIKQEQLDPLIDETFEQRWSFELYYTNTHVVKHSQKINNIIGYSLLNGNECIPTYEPISVSSASYVGLTNPINTLAHLESLAPFQIISAKVKFYYWIELSSEGKELEKVLNVDRQPTTSLSINLDDYTIFDYVNNNVVFNPIGVKGFNIPKYSHGYYELELSVLQSNTTNKFIVRNDFDFAQSQAQPVIYIIHQRIDDLEGYKEIKFND